MVIDPICQNWHEIVHLSSRRQQSLHIFSSECITCQGNICLLLTPCYFPLCSATHQALTNDLGIRLLLVQFLLSTSPAQILLTITTR